MGTKETIYMGVVVGLAVLSLSFAVQYDASGYAIVSIFFSLFSAITIFYMWYKNEQALRLSENLFYWKYGIKPEKMKILTGYIYTYDHLVYGIPKNAIRMKFWWQNTIYKGIVDLENEKLHIKEPLYIPVYDDIPIPVWKEVTKVYTTGIPKEIQFLDAHETLHSVEYFTDDGIRTQLSWKKVRGVELVWNQKEKKWRP